MDVARIRELIELMTANDLSEIRIRDGETRLMLKRGGTPVAQEIVSATPVVGAGAVEVDADRAKTAEADEDAGLSAITSPMVGTFYAAPSPDADPFVRVGDRISAETAVCIVEAMKVMNEIKAEISGVVEKVMVENAQPVEFGQPLFMVRTD